MTPKLRRITYVEDEADIRAVVEMALSMLGGFELDVYASGAEAIANAAAFDPDLILLDVMMPGIDGIEVKRKFDEMEAMRKKPVVFFTARTRASDIELYHRLGAAGIIPKPFQPECLTGDVLAIWRNWWRMVDKVKTPVGRTLN
jgi:CheY-like chemotaxis protein